MLQIEQDEARGTVTIAGRVYAQDVFLQLSHWLPIGQPFVIVKRQDDGVLVVRRLERGTGDKQHPAGWDAYVATLQLQVDRHLATPAAIAAMRTAGRALGIAAFEAGADAMHAAAADMLRGVGADGVKGCPNAANMGEHACKDRNQCWEPCGELGHSEEHVRVGRESLDKLAPGVGVRDGQVKAPDTLMAAGGSLMPCGKSEPCPGVCACIPF